MSFNTDRIWDVIVIGGGPSGMMAAGRAAERGLSVLLLEKNKSLGDKLNITGGGRCNITNAEMDRNALLKNYGDAKDFLFSPFSQFGVKDTFSFFESRGLPLIIEARKRAFPASQKAVDVTKVMERYIADGRVTVKKGVKITNITTNKKIILSANTSSDKFKARYFILATGGLSRPETGSTGDGFSWLRELKHTVDVPSPDIVPISVEDKWVKDLSGITMSFMKISFYLDGVKQFSKTGEILFTHFGLSGPLIMNSAKDIKKVLRAGTITALIDAYPDTDQSALEKHIIKVFNNNKNKNLKNILDEITPLGTGEAIFSLLTIPLETKTHSVTKEQRKQIVHLLKALPLTVTGLMGFDRAVVSDGGVDLKEIDTKTMKSRLIDNLYITGDLLNISRPSGGFSLQLCWTTGFVAGNSIPIG
ncbi:MAG: aminoacetone oxidase family FAD-binding enzyme [Candidatus Yonathbacteria bacterium]|nr:aminoacetone oxidase family FAD-binding enzyme [Candidatus Yonathbacteria bacterium]